MDDKKMIFDLITDSWGIIKKYGFEKMSDDDWMKLIDETHNIEKKWKDVSVVHYHLYRRIITALIDYVECHQKVLKEDSNG